MRFTELKVKAGIFERAKAGQTASHTGSKSRSRQARQPTATPPDVFTGLWTSESGIPADPPTGP